MDKALVFIHGFGGCSDIWRWQTEFFSVGRRVIAVDLPGHGGRPWQGEGLDAMARLVHEECRAQGIAAVDIVASSFGGLVAVRLCSLFPSFVGRVVLVGSLPRFTAADGFPAGLDALRIRKLAGQLSGDGGAILDVFFRSLFTMKERESPQYARIRGLRRELPVPCLDASLAVLDMLEREDLRAELGVLNVPLLFLSGDSDPLCPLAMGEVLRNMYPSARIEAFRDIGHFPFLSVPEVFNRRVERFLS